MKKLTIDTFISAINDNELSQYYVLGSLQNYYQQLNRNKLYPALSELFDLGKLLGDIVTQKSELQKMFPQQSENNSITESVGVANKETFIESDMDKVFEFINWAYPKIKDALAEGKAIYSFVKQNIKIEEIGILPIYKNEGYFVITNPKQKLVHVYRYEIPFIALDKNSSSALKVSSIKTYHSSDLINKSLLKIELVKEFNDLPNPATYSFETELDFPFEETILPIAKRRLIKKLAA